MNITDATTHEFKYPNLPNLLDIKKLDLRIKGPSYLDYLAVEYSNNVSSYSFGRYGRQNIRDNRSKDAQDVITFIGHQVETISLRFDTDRDIVGNYLEMILALFLSVQHIEVYGGMIKGVFPDRFSRNVQNLASLVLNEVDMYESSMVYVSENLTKIEKLTLKN